MKELFVQQQIRSSNIPKTPEQLEKEQLDREMEEYISRHRAFFNVISGDNSINYRSGEGFRIHFKEGLIELDSQDLKKSKEMGESKDQILWSVLHEIAHFRDYAEDPEGTLEKFDHFEKKASKLAPRALEIWRKKNPNLPDFVDTDSAKDFIYGKIKDFYNAMDDIYANRLIEERLSNYFGSKFQGGKETKRLYRDFLFPTSHEKMGQPPQENEPVDYAKFPLNQQLGYYSLRKTMVPDQDILIDKKVSDVLKRDILEENTIKEEISHICRPSSKFASVPHTSKWRLEQIKEWVEPAFLELLMEDLKNLPLPDKKDFENSKNKKQSGQPQKDGQKQEGKEKPDDKQKGKEDKKSEKQDGSQKNPEQEKEDGQKPKSGQPSPSDQKPQGQEKPDGKQKGQEKSKKKNQEGQPGSAGKDSTPSDEKETEGKKGENQASPWSEIPKFKPNLTAEDIKNFIKERAEKEKFEKEKKEQEEKEKNLSIEEKNDRDLKEKDRKFCQRHNIPEKVAADYRDLEKSIAGFKQELANVFAQMVNTISERIGTAWEEGFRSGRFNIKTFVKKYGKYMDEKTIPFLRFDQLDTFDQKEFISKLTLFPDKMRVRLVIDGSGSMKEDNRIKAARQVYVLLMEALHSAQLNVNNGLKKRSLRLPREFVIDTQVWIFGDKGDAKVIKNFSEKSKFNEEINRKEKLTGLLEIQPSFDATCDAEAWWQIFAELAESPEYIRELQSGKAKEIIFEITDGGSNKSYHDNVEGPADTKAAIDKITELFPDSQTAGIVKAGIQIGEPQNDEKRAFKYIWKEDGIPLGNQLEKLADFVTKKILAEIKKIDFTVTSREDVDDETD